MDHLQIRIRHSESEIIDLVDLALMRTIVHFPYLSVYLGQQENKRKYIMR